MAKSGCVATAFSISPGRNLQSQGEESAGYHLALKVARRAHVGARNWKLYRSRQACNRSVVGYFGYLIPIGIVRESLGLSGSGRGIAPERRVDFG
jgi:hypothetical protein